MISSYSNNPADLRDRITALFAERMQIEVPAEDTDLFEAGVLDSLRFVELLVCLEEEFGAKCSAEDLELDYFRSIVKIAEFVREKRAASQSMPAVA